MFSVNNFYAVFNSHYGWPRKNNNLWVFDPHGSKDWVDLTRYGDRSDLLNHGAIIMHDQEPFFKESVSAFAQTFLSSTMRSGTWASVRQSVIVKPYFAELEPLDSLTYFIRSSEVPIFCHSEKNSADIEWLEDNNIITCYYWWHGMIARDWFRHWERHAGLSVYNKSAATNRFIFYCRDSSGTRKYRTKVKEHLSDYSVLHSQANACPTNSATISVDDANNSAVHIVAETLFDTDKIYLTEKVFKPMVMSQPFILLGPPGSLQYLKDYGFKTFDSLWDERYDSISNHAERKASVLALVDHLHSLPTDDFFDLFEQALPVIEHNRTHFFSSTFQDMLWKEMSSNMAAALAKQTSLRERCPGGTDFYHHSKSIEHAPLTMEQKQHIKNTIETGLVEKDWVLRRYPVLANLL